MRGLVKIHLSLVCMFVWIFYVLSYYYMSTLEMSIAHIIKRCMNVLCLLSSTYYLSHCKSV